MKTKKYKLREDLKIEVLGITLFRIECIEEFNGVEKGELGGYIEKEGNLTHKGNAWVSGDAMVYGNARVSPINITNSCKWDITITDNHIKVGCEMKTFQEWLDWLDSDEEFETPRDSDEFKKIETAIRCSVELAKSTGRFNNENKSKD